MKDNINNLREQLTKKLDTLVQNTEFIYLDLARDFPLLLGELDESLKRSSSSTENLTGRGGSLDSIDMIINEGDEIIDDFNNAFTSMYSRDGELFEIIERGINEMGTLAEVINNIKEGSIEMELISLNAMTVALKSGTAGKALSFITDELKKLSAQTIKLTDELTVNGRQQLKRFKNFGETIEATRLKQNELTSNMDNHLKSSFTTASRGLQESAEMMRSLSRSSAVVKEPLTRIMQEIQLQDIIRQSIDHIYISIDEFKSYEENWTNEEKLDELSFRRLMPDLCFTVLEDVKNEIVSSCQIFEDKSASVKSTLENLEEKRIHFINAQLSSSANEDFNIMSLKDESSERINSLIKEVNVSVKHRLQISQDGLGLLKDIKTLQRQFESFEPIITRFHNIIVASRIEVAKQAALSDMKDTVKKMTSLTEDINNDISSALETIKHFLKTTQGVISNYSLTLKIEMPGIKTLIERTAENQEKLNGISDILIGSLRDFRIFTKDFLTLFKRTDTNRKKLTSLSVSISEIEMILSNIKEKSESDIIQIQGIKNIENWTIKSERLNSIIEKFTIFTHKKTASDLAGTAVEVEEIAESGEVTLF